MEVQRNTMSNNNKDSRQDDEGNDKDSNITAQGGVWRVEAGCIEFGTTEPSPTL